MLAVFRDRQNWSVSLFLTFGGNERIEFEFKRFVALAEQVVVDQCRGLLETVPVEIRKRPCDEKLQQFRSDVPVEQPVFKLVILLRITRIRSFGTVRASAIGFRRIFGACTTTASRLGSRSSMHC